MPRRVLLCGCAAVGWDSRRPACAGPRPSDWNWSWMCVCRGCRRATSRGRARWGAAFLTAPRPSGQQSTARYVLAIPARKINTSFLIWYFFLNTAQDPLITSLRPFLTPRSHAPSRKAAARQRLTRVPAARRLPEWRRGCGKNGGESAARTEADHEVTLVIPRMWSSMRPPPARRSAAPRRS
jgi:hypothetical protein